MIRQHQTPIAVVCFIILAVLTACVLSGSTNGFDVQIHDWALGVFPSGNEGVWQSITFFGSGLAISALTVLTVIILSLRQKWVDVKYLIFVMVAAGATEVTMKSLIHRPRPLEVFAHTLPNSFSFPSGHTIYGTTFYLAIALIVTLHIKGSSRILVWSAAALLALLIGASRIFLGVHYFTDVVGGFLVAGFWLSQPWNFSTKH
jgi:undecaprenyl-diphosphatase